MRTQSRPESPKGRRVGYMGALILATLTLLAGFSVYLVMEQQSRAILGQSLGNLLQEKIHVFSQEISQPHGIDSPAAIKYRHPLILAVQEINKNPEDKQAQDQLLRISTLLMQETFLAISVFDNKGTLRLRLGKESDAVALRMPLDTEYPSALMWKGQFIIHAHIALRDRGQVIGQIVTEMAMPRLTEVFQTTQTIGATGEFVICKALQNDAQNMQCFINGFQNQRFFEKQARVIDGVQLPMDHALRGESGLVFANDYRSEPVTAAYAPVGTTGLGMVLKIDQSELYAPITASLKFIIPLLVMLVVVGVLLLRWLVTPLVQSLVSSERAATNTNLDLEKSRERFRQVIDNAPYSIHEMDQEGKIVSVNPAGLIMARVATEDEIVGTDYLEQNVSMKDRDRVASYMATGLHGETSVFEYTGISGRIFQANFVPLVDAEKNTIHIMGWTQDITQAKLHSEHMQRSQKMDALGKLTGGISHDFNNMLGIILGYTEMLAESLAEQPTLAGFVDEIHKAGERGAKLTRRLQGFSRHSQSDKNILDVNELLSGMQLMLEKTLTARIDLKIVYAKQLWPILLDASELEDAIINISINAMHAIEGTGHFSIETENVQLGKAAAHTLNLEPGDYILLSLTDTGCGMNEGVKEKIFDPFYTTKGDKGTGLGLSQVLSFVARSKGAVHVTSEPGTGTRFELYFARAHLEDDTTDTDHPANIQHGQNKSTDAAKEADFDGTETILVVDDEEGLLNLVSKLLLRRGYTVFTASGGSEALKILDTETIDLMLSDIIMPKMDGFELVAIVRERYPAVKIQLASGYADRVIDPDSDDVDDVTARENWLHKPYSAKLLSKRLRELLD